MSPSRVAPRTIVIVAAFAALTAYAFFIAFIPIWDTDIWWHLRVGEWMAAERRLPHSDLFSSVDPDQPWKSFQWLFQALSYGVHQLWGARGLRVATALITVGGYAVWAGYFRRETRSWPLTLALTALLLLLFDDRIRARPHLFNLVGEGAVAWFCARGLLLATWRRRALYFVLFWLWANLHDPGALFGAAAVAAGALAQLAWTRAQKQPLRARVRELVWPVGLAALAVVTTPYGPSLVWAAQENISPVHLAIGEWQPVLTYLERAHSLHHVVCALLPFAALLLALAVVLARLVRRTLVTPANLPWLARAAVPLAFAAVSLTAMRFVYLAVAPLAWLAGAVDWQTHRRAALALSAAVVATALVASWQYSVPGVDRSADIKADEYPEAATQLIAEARLNGRVFAMTDWGGYVLWFARPPRGVATDGRYNLSPPVRAALHDVEQSLGRDGAVIDRAVRSLGSDLVILPAAAFPFDEWPGWSRVAHDGVSETFLREGAPDEAAVRAFVHPRDGESIESAATRLFGARYASSHAVRIAQFAEAASRGDHGAVHQLGEAKRLSGDLDGAIGYWRAHLAAQPNCIEAATELARVLHARGAYEAAARLLAPAERLPSVPWATGAWLVHLRTHVAR
ncbi:MAG: hypothetical protein JWN44_1094 [Myxococcales bacterium]|nr:hypothetical protein [Myxococcales bacterium]